MQLKMKHMEEMHLDSLPKSSLKSIRIGRLARGTTNYDVWSVGREAPTEGSHSAIAAAGEEFMGMSCLLPRKSKKGKLYLGSSGFTRKCWRSLTRNSSRSISVEAN
jgi:hypothetical protein